MKPYKVISDELDGCWDLTRRKSLSAAFCFARNRLAWHQVKAIQIVDTRTGRVWKL